jgi:DNA-binding MarR family transcriptional regulator
MDRQPPPELSTWRAFQWAHTLIMNRLRADLREDRMTLEEFDVLIHLYRAADGTLSLRGLHESLVLGTALTRSGLTRLLDRLDASGLVSRALDPTDRRRFRVTITDAGRARFEMVWPRLEQQIHAYFLEPLKDFPITQLDDALQRLIAANFQEPSHPDEE